MLDIHINPFIHIKDERNISFDAFMNKCVDCGNKEALYRKGMVNFFRNENPDVALELIDKALKGGHDAATYGFAIISIFLGGEYSREGVKTIGEMLRARPS
uniref:F-box protein n=1 Tax=Solanum tuberosum TaxID=4113 RepID=M1D809_SOLTU